MNNEQFQKAMTTIKNYVDSEISKVNIGGGGDEPTPPVTIVGLYNPYKNAPTNQLKFQMHCHSSSSDGVQDTTTLVNDYLEAGFDNLAVTNHDHISTPNSGDFTGIKGVEESEVGQHIGIIGVTSQSSVSNRFDAIEHHRINNPNAIITINHPKREEQSWTDEDLLVIDMDCIEIYNAKSESDSLTYNHEETWDMLLSNGRQVWGVATDDCHDTTDSTNFNCGYIQVLSNVNSENTILSAIKNGQFYAIVKGHDLTISFDENTKTITATSSKNSNIYFISENGIVGTHNGVTTATYTIPDTDKIYVRVKSVDASDTSKCAYSQPIFLDYKDITVYPLETIENITWESGSFEELTGEERTSTASYRTVENIPIDLQYEYYGIFDEYSAWVSVFYYDTNGNYLGYIKIEDGEKWNHMTYNIDTFNGDATSFRLKFASPYNTPEKTLELINGGHVVLKRKQCSYSIGFEEENISWESGSFDESTGSETTSPASYRLVNSIILEKNCKYYVEIPANSTAFQGFYYGEDESFISYVDGLGTYSNSWVYPIDTTLGAVSFRMKIRSSLGSASDTQTLVSQIKIICKNKIYETTETVSTMSMNTTINNNIMNNYQIWVGTQAEFDALSTKSDTIIYMITD